MQAVCWCGIINISMLQVCKGRHIDLVVYVRQTIRVLHDIGNFYMFNLPLVLAAVGRGCSGCGLSNRSNNTVPALSMGFTRRYVISVAQCDD